jgi:glycine C-acetyltransferase
VIPLALGERLVDRAIGAEAPVVEAAAPGMVEVGGREMVNMASNDYLGLARDPRVIAAAHAALEDWGLGSAAGRVLSGNTAPHRDLERALAAWVGSSDAALFGSCWTANAAIFAVLGELAAEASSTLAVFSDRLNHASIIDAIRAQRRTISRVGVFDHDETLDGLREQLGTAAGGDAVRVIVTDGVFSMEGDEAPLNALADLAEEFDALLIVDDSHGTGVVGATGRGTSEAQNAIGRIDVVTGTLGKALGGAIGGFVAGPERLMQLLRTTARPFVFSNNPPSTVVAGALKALELLAQDRELLDTLRARVRRLRDGIVGLGLRTVPGEHPIVPVLLGDEDVARAASARLADAGVFATALTFPIVPRDEARLRLQVSGAHSEDAIDQVLNALA